MTTGEAGLSGEHTDWQPAFGLSKQQREAASVWMREHDKSHIKPGETRRYTGAIGGAYTWSFTGTSLGTVTKLKCACGETIDVSNYDDW